MKKRILTLLLVCVFLLSACNQTENPAETTQTTEITEITETTETTETTEITRPTVHFEIVCAGPLQTESPELQRKIEEYQNHRINDIDCKVILTIGTHTDVPYGMFGESEWLTEWMYSDDEIRKNNAWQQGAWYNRAHNWGRISYNEAVISPYEENLPVYEVSGEKNFSVAVNDVIVETPIEILIDGEQGNYRKYGTISELCNDLESGRYYARITATCYGDTLFVDGRKEFTEWLSAYYFFVIEIE